MIIRIVKMTFLPDKTSEFVTLFEEFKLQIRHFEGCQYLELLQDSIHENVYFTYSHWQHQQALENYRHSDLFKKVWTRTKVMFIEKPMAWSLHSKVKVN